ncbi:MAG: 5'/3'-nucleotidase SurE [Saprospiraceae bacterium]
MKNQRPLILVTNDDGILANGIKALVEVAKNFGEVIVVAPDKPQSGQGHAITLTNPLRVRKVDPFNGIEAYECSGTPADCVKIARHSILKDRKIDLCVSGINHGSNASINIIYSGTMSAAMEASINDIPALGFSLLDFSQDADFEPSKRYIGELIRYTLDNGLDNTKLLNVNIPKLPADKIKGIRICRQAEAQWVENFKEGLDPSQQPYFWLTGVFVNRDQGHDTDVWALSEGYVSVVPCAHDLTAYKAIGELKGLEN